MKRSLCALALSLAFTAAPASAAVTAYSDSAAFFAALGSAPYTTETYEGPPQGTAIPDASVLNGLTYFFETQANLGGVISDEFVSFDAQSLSAEYDGAAGDSPTNDFFRPGDFFVVTFPQPVYAAGIFVNIGASTTETDYVALVTDVGNAFSGGPTPDTSPSFFFVGLISDTPFDSALFGGLANAPTGFTFDNLVYGGAIPNPAALPAGLALMLLMLRRRRRA